MTELADAAEALAHAADEIWDVKGSMEAASALDTLSDRIATESQRFGDLLRMLERAQRGDLAWTIVEEDGLAAGPDGADRPAARSE